MVKSNRGRKLLNLDKNLLNILYIENEMTTYDIAFLLECSQGSIMNYLKKYNIKIRNLSEAQKLAIKMADQEICL